MAVIMLHDSQQRASKSSISWSGVSNRAHVFGSVSGERDSVADRVFWATRVSETHPWR